MQQLVAQYKGPLCRAQLVPMVRIEPDRSLCRIDTGDDRLTRVVPTLAYLGMCGQWPEDAAAQRCPRGIDVLPRALQTRFLIVPFSPPGHRANPSTLSV